MSSSLHCDTHTLTDIHSYCIFILRAHYDQFIPEGVLVEARLEMDPCFLSAAFFMAEKYLSFLVALMAPPTSMWKKLHTLVF